MNTTMSKLSTEQSRNWLELSDVIRERPIPLGVGLKQQCFIGLAVELAASRNLTFKDAYGMSIWEARTDIRDSANCAEAERNERMVDRDRKSVV